VVYIDEVVQLNLPTASQSWQPLQQELYKVDNGGELFYQAIDTLLAKPETASLIFELFYFCLADGFRGRYANSPEKLKLYRSLLTHRIPTRNLIKRVQEQETPTRRIELVPFPKWTYAASVGIAVLGFALAHLVGYLELKF
jgi:type IV/VI secretion system ImpK/VasF family protein